MTSYKLIYFDLKGRAQISRLLFAVAGVEYEDCRIPFADWPALKATMPFKQMPALEINGKKHAQSYAIARYLANEFGFYGKDNLERLEIDQIVEQLKDFIFYLDRSFRESDQDKKAEFMKEAIEVHSLAALHVFEDLMKASTTGFFVGSKLSLADLSVFDIMDYITERNATALDDCPHLKSFREKIESIDAVRAYMDQNKKQ